MLFHAFRVVYTVKELDSHAKHGQSFKNKFGRITVFLCQKSHFRIRTSFGEFFSIVVLTFTFTFNHLADAFIQSDVQMRRTIEAIRPSREQQYTSAMTSLS